MRQYVKPIVIGVCATSQRGERLYPIGETASTLPLALPLIGKPVLQ